MRKCLALLVATVATIGFGSSAQAMVITEGVHVLNGALGGVVVAIDNTIGSGGAGLAKIDITADVLKGHTLAGLNFNISAPGTESVNYKVTLTLKNLVTPFNTAAGWAMNGFDLASINNGGFPVVGLGEPRTSDKFGFSNPGTIPNGFRFGGFNGGGGEIYNTDVAISSIILGTTSLGATASTFTLNFTANPEPATLLLGTLAMIPAGLVIRRRRKAAAEVVA